MMILLLVVMIIVVFSLNVHRSYRTDNHPRLDNVTNVDADIPYCAGQDKQKLLAVTGSNSKTTTKDMLAQLLATSVDRKSFCLS